MELSCLAAFPLCFPSKRHKHSLPESGNAGIWGVLTEERRWCGHGPSPAAMTWGWQAALVRVQS